MSFRFLFLLAGLCMLPFAASAQTNDDAALPPHAPDQLIVKFKSYIDESSRAALLAKLQAQRIEHLALIDAELIHVPKEHSLSELMGTLHSNPWVQYAEPNYALKTSATAAPVPNDSYFSNQWGLKNTGQFNGKTGADIEAPASWQLYKPKMVVTVAVIDTGVDYTHPDLTWNISISKMEDINQDGLLTKKDLNGKDEDKNGYKDDVAGWNFVDNNSESMDDNGHGTHVAGIIAAQVNNRAGIAGVAGQGYVKILPLKFLDKNGSGYTSNAVKAIDYAISKNAQIVNCSWGGSASNQSLYDAFQRFQAKGGLVVAAAGNNAGNDDKTPLYPASYNLKNEIAVASMNSDDTLSSFSNYGTTTVQLGAPGAYIFSTYPGNRYAYMSGTSMAAPFVSGVAALVWSQKGATTGADVKNIILSKVRHVKVLEGKTTTGGALDAKNALSP